MLYTFLTETNGSTVIDQFEGRDLAKALRRWNKLSPVRPGFTEDELFDSGRGGPTPVAGRKATWCFSGINSKGQFFLVHIVATSRRALAENSRPGG